MRNIFDEGKKSSVYVLVLLFLLGLGAGCRETSTVPAPVDAAYFPLQIGDYWVYQVTQEKYVAANQSTKVVYQLQEQISSSYDQNGQLVYLIEESIRSGGQSAWKLNGIYTVYKSLSEVVSQQNNVPIVTMAFPIATATSWNVNAYNARPDTLLQYQDPSRPFAVGKLSFANTVSVVGTNDSTLVSQQKYLRVYAPAVGLVYRQNLSLAFCQSSPDCVGKGIVTSGTKQTWELIAGNRLP